MLKAGTKRYLIGNEHKPYVKLDNEGFGWWRLEDDSVDENRRMMVRITDEDVLNENHFIIKKIN